MWFIGLFLLVAWYLFTIRSPFSLRPNMEQINALFVVHLNDGSYRVVLDTGSVYTILHRPSTVPSSASLTTIEYGSQQSLVHFAPMSLQIDGTKSIHTYPVGLAQPQPTHYNILGLGRGSSYDTFFIDFPRRQFKLMHRMAPTLPWVQPAHLPTHVYVLPATVHIPHSRIQFIILDTGCNVTSIPSGEFILFQSQASVSLSTYDQSFTFPITSENIAGDSPFHDTIVVGSMWLQSKQLWVTPSGCHMM